MKFMKLGSRPDTFYTSEGIRSVSSEVSSDLLIQVKDTRYLLHKFPLLSKSLRLQRLCSEAPDSSPHQLLRLPEFPGGDEAFELCAKFCYGITITLSAYNIVAARCAAEYLQMTEDVEKGNLVYKIEVFLNSCIFLGWRDSIVTLKATRAFPLWSEDLRITSRCIEAISTKVLTNPSKVSLSHSQSRRGGDNLSCNVAEIQSQRNYKFLSKGWWAEDIAELGIDLYWRTMIAIKSGGRVPSNLIGDALKVYASCWLPKIPISNRTDADIGSDSDSEGNMEITSKTRLLLESIISLLPAERGAVSCSFLLKLLKAANILGASPSSKMELARRIGIQLEEATAKDLLIPPPTRASELLYDMDIVMNIVELFMLQSQSPPTSPPRFRPEFVERRRSRSAENIDLDFQESRRSSSASHSSKLKVAKIIDGYLQAIGRDVNLPLSKFMALAEAVPDYARIDHDNLYKAIDIYLKAHSDLTKGERKRLCRILDCKKLSMEACMHAAQNEMLPLRVVVQVLFFEQARATKSGNKVADLPDNIKALLELHGIDPSRPPAPLSTTTASVPADDQWSVSVIKSPKRIPTLKMKLAEDEELDGTGRNNTKLRGLCVIPGRPRRMLGKFWSNGRSANANGNDKN